MNVCKTLLNEVVFS